jgi:hypothetical protein
LQGTGITVTVGATTNAGTYGSAGSSSFGSYLTAGGGFASDKYSYNLVGMSGTTFVSGRNLTVTPTLKQFITSYGTGDWIGANGANYSLVYNPVGGFYMTQPNSSGVYYTSTDGLTWTRRTGGPSSGSYQNSYMHVANGRIWMGFSTLGGSNVDYYVSSTADGTTWTGTQAWNNTNGGSTAFGNFLYDIIYFAPNSTYYAFGAVANNAAIYVQSTTTATSVFSTSALGGVTANSYGFCRALTNNTNQIIYFYTDGSGVLKSLIFNGTTWSSGNTTVPGTGSNYPTNGQWDGSKYVVALVDGSIWTSTNGTTWTAQGTTIYGLKIDGYTSPYYYGTISGVFAYTSNLSSWNTINWNGGVRYQSYNSAGVNGTKFTFPPQFNNGLIGTFDIASQNTTIMPGYNGIYTGAYTKSYGGGAGGEPKGYYSYNGSSTSITTITDGSGIDGYGVSIANSLTVPVTYGSTNGSMGQQGAVILEWVA